jgi:hypothetical protein
MTTGAMVTVLGVVPAGSAARVAAAFGGAIPVAVCRAGGIAGFAVQGRAWPQHRTALRAALIRAASASAFLPADPRHALCEASAWPRVITAAAAPLAEALAQDGGTQQWEVTVAPGGHRISAAAAATRIRSALAPHALGFRLRGMRSGLVLSVRLPRAAAWSVGDAVASLGERFGGVITVEGPLPPLGFSAFRLERAESAAVERAWAMLALRDRTDSAEIARRWRGLAFALDPEHSGGRQPLRPLREAGHAYGLLRGLSEGLGAGPFRRDEIFALCGSTVAVPTSREPRTQQRAMVPA